MLSEYDAQSYLKVIGVLDYQAIRRECCVLVGCVNQLTRAGNSPLFDQDASLSNSLTDFK